MGRRKKQTDTAENGTTPKPGNNPLTREVVTSYVERVENLHDDLAKEQSAYMLACKGIRGDIKEVYTEAKDAGMTKAALKAKVKEREYRRKADACRENLEPEQLDMFDMISQALGEIDEKPASNDEYFTDKPGGPLAETPATAA